MNIIVLVKQVPNTTEVRIDPKTGNLIREGVESIINPEDRHALEAALKIKDSMPAQVIVMSMGPPQAVEVICEALAMGADRGILLTDRVFAGADTWATSTALGMAIRKVEDFDLILAGRQAVDGDTAQIGPQVAEFLDIPQLTYVQGLEVREGTVIAERVLEDGCEHIEAPTPVLVTVLASLNEPRYPTVPGMLDATAESSPIEIWNAGDLGAKAETAVFVDLLQRGVPCGYYAESQREVDFVYGSHSAPHAVEVKYDNTFRWEDRRFDGVRLFLRRFPVCRHVTTVTRDAVGEVQVGDVKVTAVQLWRFLLRESL